MARLQTHPSNRTNRDRRESRRQNKSALLICKGVMTVCLDRTVKGEKRRKINHQRRTFDVPFSLSDASLEYFSSIQFQIIES